MQVLVNLFRISTIMQKTNTEVQATLSQWYQPLALLFEGRENNWHYAFRIFTENFIIILENIEPHEAPRLSEYEQRCLV